MKKLLIIIPMAGAGSRFKKLYKEPKPLIDVCGKVMIQRVVECLIFPNRDLHFIFVAQENHVKEYELDKKFEYIFDDIQDNNKEQKITFQIVSINGITQGQTCSVLKSRKILELEENINNEILIANSDQILEWNNGKSFIDLIDKNIDCQGAIITSFSDNPKWSFVRLDFSNKGYISEVKEKEIISNICNVGIFYFRKAKYFIESADWEINNQILVNNEYYVSLVYNYLINSLGHSVINFPISNIAFWGTGTPPDLDMYIEHLKEISKSL